MSIYLFFGVFNSAELIIRSTSNCLIDIFIPVLGCEYGICEGVEMALAKFRMYEKSKLEIQAKYAFGAVGKPEFTIPPDADVEYTVTLKNIKRVSDVYCSTC